MKRTLRVCISINAAWLSSSIAAGFSSAALQKTYREISERSNELRQWPDASSFRKNLVFGSNGRLVPPRFDDGQGSIGVFAMLDRNPDASRNLQVCRAAFDSFCGQGRDEITDSKQWGQARVLWTPEGTYHISVSIIQQHPSFLRSDEDRRHWRPLDTTVKSRLVTELASYQSINCLQPVLRLDSLYWTPDGAMIAGFVEELGTGTATNAFDRLKESSNDISLRILDTERLVSRPKNMIHVTIGRFLGLSDEAPLEQS